MTITKASLASVLFDNIGLNKREAQDFTVLLLNEIKRELQRGDMVKLSGFGSFEVRAKNERPGRNPKTGEEVPITARNVVTFKPSMRLRKEVASISTPDEADSADLPDSGGKRKRG